MGTGEHRRRALVRDALIGQRANLEEGARAKTRSKHNTFIVLPVVFTMISNHYSGTYGSKYNWIRSIGVDDSCGSGMICNAVALPGACTNT